MHHRFAGNQAAVVTEGQLIHWSRAYDVVFRRFIRRSDRPILDLAGVGEGDRLLDVGTGPGYLARAAGALVGPGGEAVGVDASPEMVARATALAERERVPARFVHAPAESLPFDDDTFDVAVSRLVMHHLPGDLKERALTEIRRVLRPGGRLLLADFGSPRATAFHHVLAGVMGGRRGHEDSLEGLVRRSGYVEVETGAVGRGMLAYVRARVPSESGR